MTGSFLTILLVTVLLDGLTHGFQLHPLHSLRRVQSSCTVAKMSTAAIEGVDVAAPMLKSILKKPSKTLTVGVECVHGKLSESELSILSMQLRKCKVSSIWCSDVNSIKEIVSEQKSAKGNFPGPCPVIYHGPMDQASSAVEIGASAIVASVKDQPVAGCEVVWRVSTLGDAQSILQKTEDLADAFWLDGFDKEQFSQIVQVLPKGSLCIASVDPMQPDGREVEEAREYMKFGCSSILIRQACIGDTEDIEYAQFLVSGLTSKASSEFKFSGLTGSTNGHFGGVQPSSTTKWRRVRS